MVDAQFSHESHTISQSIETPSGNYWHAIMHRREGDYSNAKYWFRRGFSPDIFLAGGPHQTYAAVERDKFVRDAIDSNPWDPNRFVDLARRPQTTDPKSRDSAAPCRRLNASYCSTIVIIAPSSAKNAVRLPENS